MKKNYFILFIASFLFSNMLFAQNVNIPDVAFKNFLLSIYDLNTDGDLLNISEEEAASYSHNLYIYKNDIESLEGFQKFTSLKHIFIYGTKLKNTNFLPPNLTYLRCDSNQIETLTNLPESLTELSCRKNKIKSLPTKLPVSLSSLDCSYNLLNDLPELSQELTDLHCRNNILYLIITD